MLRNFTIGTRLIISFLIVVAVMVIAASITNYSSYLQAQEATTETALSVMKQELGEYADDIDSQHEKASSDLVLTMQYPVFKEFYELPETKAGNVYDENGVLQFTENQRALKNKLDKWTDFLQSNFEIDETCLIDHTGQEHSRLVFEKVAPDEDLSPEEAAADFFEPSLKIGENEVHIQYPYMSADSERWVIAYTSPIILDDGSKPAFYHFEIPISVIQGIVGIHDPTEAHDHHESRVIILDQEDLLIADSGTNIDIELKGSIDDEHTLADYLPTPDVISTNPEFKAILEKMKAGEAGQGTFVEDGETYYVVYEPLSTFGCSIASIKGHHILSKGQVSLAKIQADTVKVIVVGTLIALVLAVYISRSISNSLTSLRDAATQVADGDVEKKIDVSGKDEVSEVAQSVDKMRACLKLVMDEYNNKK